MLTLEGMLESKVERAHIKCVSFNQEFIQVNTERGKLVKIRIRHFIIGEIIA